MAVPPPLAARLAVLALWALPAAGCVTTVEVGGPVAPSAVSAPRLPAKVAVLIQEPTGPYGENVRLGSVAGIPRTLYFDYGDVLADALYRGVLAVYQDATRVLERPHSGRYERIISLLIQTHSDTGPRRLLASAGDRFSISIAMEALDGSTLELLHRAAVRRTVTYDGNPQGFAKTIEKAIQQLSDDVAQQLAAGFAEYADPRRL